MPPTSAHVSLCTACGSRPAPRAQCRCTCPPSGGGAAICLQQAVPCLGQGTGVVRRGCQALMRLSSVHILWPPRSCLQVCLCCWCWHGAWAATSSHTGEAPDLGPPLQCQHTPTLRTPSTLPMGQASSPAAGMCADQPGTCVCMCASAPVFVWRVDTAMPPACLPAPAVLQVQVHD